MSDEQLPSFDLETPDIPMPEIQEKQEIKDTVSGAFKLCFIGSGQGGGRLAESFYRIGYRRIAIINTAQQDLATISLPDSSKLYLGGEGAGKNPSAAAKLFDDRREDVLDFMRRNFGPTFDRIIVTVGAGGGTGAGTVMGLVKTAKELQESLKITDSRVGVVVALPKNSEGKKVNENAYFTLSALVDGVSSGLVSPLIIIDNERIGQIYPGLQVGQFWATANQSVAALLHLFNNICTHKSSFTSFDKTDLATILDSGIIVFGATPVKKWADATDISYAVRDNLKRNILSGGVDLATGSVAAAVIIGGQEVLNSTPQEFLDHGFEQLTRLLKPGSTVHRGIYSGSKETLAVYSAIGGLASPQAKLDELKTLGDVIVNHKAGVGPVLGESV